MLLAMGILGFLALLGVVSAGLLAYLFIRLTDRVASLERRARELAAECRALHQQVDSMPTRLVSERAAGALDHAAGLPALIPAVTTPATLDTGMNLSKRVQILRLHRRGESSAHIASVLNLPLA
jgi:hypothetical protein